MLDKMILSKNLPTNTIKRKGFSLAEILLTITVIGIIASTTIPSLITSVQDTQFKALWKKTFNRLAAATEAIKEDNGGTMLNVTTNNGVYGQLGFATVYSKYMKYLKMCDTWGCTSIPWHQSYEWSDMSGVPLANGGWHNSGLILVDGSYIRIHGWGGATADECSGNNLGVETCAEIMLDTNGHRGPNMVGKDIFGVHLTKFGIQPWGLPPYQGVVPAGQYGDDQYSYSNCSATAVPNHGGTERGWACGYKYLLE